MTNYLYLYHKMPIVRTSTEDQCLTDRNYFLTRSNNNITWLMACESMMTVSEARIISRAYLAGCGSIMQCRTAPLCLWSTGGTFLLWDLWVKLCTECGRACVPSTDCRITRSQFSSCCNDANSAAMQVWEVLRSTGPTLHSKWLLPCHWKWFYWRWNFISLACA